MDFIVIPFIIVIIWILLTGPKKEKKMKTEKEIHEKVMSELQGEWMGDRCFYETQRDTMYGIRSSQISTLVMYLIKTGVIKEKND